ncbi:MAG: hypothetical protein IIV45_15165, partial [Lachnospiraceae bacterium]|nr:hypothetical protein [Lachnospiraceae bacterium]
NLPYEKSSVYGFFTLISISEQFIAKRRREFQILVCHQCYLFCSFYILRIAATTTLSDRRAAT